MTKLIQAGILCLICAAIFVPTASAQEFEVPPPAPIPAQILSAKKLFLSNCGNSVEARDTVPVGLPFDELYASVQTWGRFDLAPSPANADLVFEFSYQYADFSYHNVTRATWPQLRLAIVDPKTHIVLWAFTQEVNTQASDSAVRNNLDKGIAALLNQLRAKVGEPPLPMPPKPVKVKPAPVPAPAPDGKKHVW